MADVNGYLNQQLYADKPPNYEIQAIADVHDSPTQSELDDFKNQVKIWFEIDNSIKKMQQSIKEHNAAKGVLSNKILHFMAKYSIDDLNTKEGTLRYRVTQVKTPISQSDIKTRLVQNYDPNLSASELSNRIFDNRQVTEKHSLKRIGRRIMAI